VPFQACAGAETVLEQPFEQRFFCGQGRQAPGEQFERLLQSGGELRSLERNRLRHAAELLQDPALGLRAGDALHLAVALHSRCNQLASFDGQMLKAAAALGIKPALE
jgi:hypothetical protein